MRGNDEDLKNFFLSLHDCVSQIEHNRACNNPRYVNYLYDSVVGQVQIVVANSQSYQVLKEMFQYLLHPLWELQQDLGNKMLGNIHTGKRSPKSVRRRSSRIDFLL